MRWLVQAVADWTVIGLRHEIGWKAREVGEVRRGDSMDLNGILIGSENPQRLRDYYTKLFGKPGLDEGAFFGWQIGSGWVALGRTIK